LKDLKHVED
jgi:hypothetical protein